MNTTAIVVAILAFLSSLAGAIFTYKSAKNANKIESRKVDQVVYDREIAFYQKRLDDTYRQLDRVISQMDKVNLQLDKVNSQLDKVTIQFGAEQEISASLRKQVLLLQAQVDVLSETIADLRTKINRKPEGV